MTMKKCGADSWYDDGEHELTEKPELPVDNIVSRKDLCKMQIEMCAHFIANDYPTINTYKNSSGEKIALKLAGRMRKLVALAENGKIERLQKTCQTDGNDSETHPIWGCDGDYF